MIQWFSSRNGGSNFRPRRRSSSFLVIPVLLLALGIACSSHHHDASAPGTPPTITTGPVNASTVSGRPVTFSVAATGAAPLSYQWAKDGQPILGALTAVFTLYRPKVQDAGSYTVTVTNPNGTVTSGAATLTVAAAVSFTAPVGLAYDASGNLFVSDMDDHTIWKVDPTNQKTLVAGASGLPGSTDGQGANARFNLPGGLAFDPAGNLVVADTGNHTIRRIAPDGTVTTLAGSAGLQGTTDGVAPAGAPTQARRASCGDRSATWSTYPTAPWGADGTRGERVGTS